MTKIMRWIAFVPAGLLAVFLANSFLLALSYFGIQQFEGGAKQIFIRYILGGISIISYLVLFCAWASLIFFVPRFVCKGIAPLHKPAAIIFGAIYSTLYVRAAILYFTGTYMVWTFVIATVDLCLIIAGCKSVYKEPLEHNKSRILEGTEP